MLPPTYYKNSYINQIFYWGTIKLLKTGSPMTVNLHLKNPIFCSNSSLNKILLKLKLSSFRIYTCYNYYFLLLHYHVKNWIFETDNTNIDLHCVLVKCVHTHTHTPIHTSIATVSPCLGFTQKHPGLYHQVIEVCYHQ